MVGGPPGGLELVRSPFQRSRTARETLPTSGTAWETLPEFRKWSEALPQVQNCSGDPPGHSELLGRPSRRSGTGRETLPKVRK